ncbi:MAG: dihydroorotase [Chitinophagaceae bacterium]|nr:dihydroorotase [Chitinophagaceae bacterium]
MSTILIKQAEIINEGKRFVADVLVKDGLIDKIGTIDQQADQVIHAEGLYLMPGAIDDQVHFREPGLIHKGTIYSEAKAAVAGGVTTYMEMPNTVPNTVTLSLLEDKYTIASNCSLANYSFYLGATNDNIDEIIKADPKIICGIKVFMGSSTGNMLVDESATLSAIFSNSPMLIATHCESDPMVKANQQRIIAEYGENIDATFHPFIRDVEACYESSSMAVALAKKHNARLHILHISTAKELSLFENTLPLKEKRITAEACIHHLWFSDEDYKTKGNFIKWNPAVKSAMDREAIFQAVLDNRIDVIATDHAPHTLEEKNKRYLDAPSGGPLVQHSLLAMLDFFRKGKISLEQIVEKMCHNPAILYQINRRGYIREGYHADLVLVDPNQTETVSKDNILYHCGWSPFEGYTFTHKIKHTLVSGHLVYSEGKFNEQQYGQRLVFDR